MHVCRDAPFLTWQMTATLVCRQKAKTQLKSKTLWYKQGFPLEILLQVLQAEPNQLLRKLVSVARVQNISPCSPSWRSRRHEFLSQRQFDSFYVLEDIVLLSQKTSLFIPTLPSGSRGSNCEWMLRCVGRVSGLDYYRCRKVRQRLAFLFTLRAQNNTWLTPHQSHSHSIIPSHMTKTQTWLNLSMWEEPGDDLQPFPATLSPDDLFKCLWTIFQWRTCFSILGPLLLDVW